MRKSHAKAAVYARTGRNVEELLRELYVDRRFNLTEIGEALGVSRESIRQWLVEAGINRDDRPAVAL